MKEIFIAYSRYNQKTNAIMFSYIEKMDPSQLSSTIKAYYKSIGENVFHVIQSDIKWLFRLSKFKEAKILDDVLDGFVVDNRFSNQIFIENIKEFIRIRYDVDNAIVELVESIDEKDFINDLEIPFGKGRIEKQLWKLLFQWFNHHTHHRGQVSIQLDNVGIHNDYSLVLDKIEL